MEGRVIGILTLQIFKSPSRVIWWALQSFLIFSVTEKDETLVLQNELEIAGVSKFNFQTFLNLVPVI